jgi:hypothetical protein
MPASARGTRPGWDGGPYAFMRRVLETTLGNALYRNRQVTVEPVFAHAKFNRRIDRSNAAADPPAAPSGGSSRPPTTCSSFTSTTRPPPRSERPRLAITPPSATRSSRDINGRPSLPRAITQQPPRGTLVDSAWHPLAPRTSSRRRTLSGRTLSLRPGVASVLRTADDALGARPTRKSRASACSLRVARREAAGGRTGVKARGA